MLTLPILVAVAAEEQVPVVDSYQGETVDPGGEMGAHHDDEEDQHMSSPAAAADIGTTSSSDDAVTPPVQEELVVPAEAEQIHVGSSEEAEEGTADKAREAHSTQPLHHKDNETTVPSKKKGVPFGGFAGTAAAAVATSADTNTSATMATTKTAPIKNDDIIPPDGFVLASRIVSIDGLSYFVDSSVGDGASTESDANADAALSPPPVLGDMTIPFLDCGAVGSFTDAIGMRDCSFRHLPSGAEPFGWSTVDTPQLVVALQPLEVTVSGGGGDDGLESTRRNFRAGDVLLFEDTDGKGHKMKAALVKKKGATGGKPAAAPTLHPDMSVLIISLPPQKRHGNHHRVGTGAATTSGSKDKTAINIRLPALFGRRNSHNKEGGSVDGDTPRPCLVETDGTYSSLGPPAAQTLSDVLPSPGRLLRGAVGAVLSALMTDRWLGRGQPRISGWLGGCALVVGGTCGFAAIGEGTLESLADWWEEFVISRRFMDDEDVVDVDNNDNEDLDLSGLKEEIKEEILPQILAGRNTSEKL